ncbi:hypothetical protein GCM10007063_34750 [Lentibacillus kapialis]|uniref:Uncharacterized protein n=1 Tax=Lentibacillus kapialis TaxID=340214 RepID=A0A917Q3A7_9BACI|nr:hypothetical protein [Lentibacillus kapialis]GGK09339.1 hypothetical protein GCM10007063_34750 [Lentibacillus kapialis]
MKIKPEETAAEQAARNVYMSPFIPCLVGFGAVVIPHWSSTYALIWGLILTLLILRVFLGYLKQMHRDYKWHALTGVLVYDTTAFFLFIPFWRVVGEPLWLLFVLIGIYVLCLILTHYFRYVVVEGVLSARWRKTKFGRLYWTAAFLLVTGTAGGSYGFARTLQVFQGYNTALFVISACLIPFGIIIIIGFHSLWVRVENPDYDLESEENPN